MSALRHQFPPSFNLVADDLALARVITEFPAPSFIENIAVAPDGSLYVSSLEEGAVYHVAEDGNRALFSKIPFVAGLAFLDDGTLIAASTGSSPPGIYRLEMGQAPKLLVPIPDAKLLNGMMQLGGGRFLVADSYDSCIREFDVASGHSRVWLKHPSLANASDPFHPVPQFPGVNGLKRFGDTIYASSTEQQKLVAIPLNADLSAGEPRVFMTLINIDDFAFDVEGNIYATTHIYNTVVRITPDRRVTVIAGLEQGVAGSTAVAFGRGVADRHCIYVTTNGGMSNPPAGGIQPGRVVRIDVGKAGYFLEGA